MAKQILIDSYFGLVRTAIAEGSMLMDYYEESPDQGRAKGNIYRGVIKRIDAPIQAAFVRFGGGRDGFLPLRDAESGRKTPKVGDVLLVQVVKDEVGDKGAALTTKLSLSGRYLVYIPARENEGGISSRITDEDRAALKKILGGMSIPEGGSVILRTAAMHKRPAELQADLDRLTETYCEIEDKFGQGGEPGLMFKEVPPALRYLREYYTPEIERIWVNQEEVLNQCRQFFHLYEPASAAKVALSHDGPLMFQKMGLEADVDRLNSRKVSLPSGANIVIDQAEALVAIDVNSAKAGGRGEDGRKRGEERRPHGKVEPIVESDAMRADPAEISAGDREEVGGHGSAEAIADTDRMAKGNAKGRGKRGAAAKGDAKGRAVGNASDLEDTVFAVNLEAAGEIARQLRLRDLGGIIIVDFIDMEEEKHRRRIEEAMRKALSDDKAKVKVYDISPLGIMQISRQRLRKAGPNFSRQACEPCQGRGWHPSSSAAALTVLRKLEERLHGKKAGQNLSVAAPYPVANKLLNDFREQILSMERLFGCTLRVTALPASSGEAAILPQVPAQEDGRDREAGRPQDPMRKPEPRSNRAASNGNGPAMPSRHRSAGKRTEGPLSKAGVAEGPPMEGGTESMGPAAAEAESKSGDANRRGRTRGAGSRRPSGRAGGPAVAGGSHPANASAPSDMPARRTVPLVIQAAGPPQPKQNRDPAPQRDGGARVPSQARAPVSTAADSADAADAKNAAPGGEPHRRRRRSRRGRGGGKGGASRSPIEKA